jgi:hypothetical protein
LTLHPSSTKLKGFVAITSSKITKGEITIKTPNYNRGHPLKLSIDANNPIILPQLRFARNSLSKSLQWTKELKNGKIQEIYQVLKEKLDILDFI